MIDLDNTLVFETSLKSSRSEVKKEIEKIFSIKVDKVRIQIRNNKKFAFVKLAKENPAIDVATKLGMI
jgi:large subunit ribosomal protein L23